MSFQRINHLTTRSRWRFMLLSLFLFFLIPVVPAAEAADIESAEVIRFGVFPYKTSKSLIEMYAPLALRLEKKLGKKIQLVSAPDADSFFEQVKGGGYDIILSSITMYYTLKPAGYKVIARGWPDFYGGVIVHKESPIQTIADLKGKSMITTGEYGITYLVLLPQLAAEGIVPIRDTTLHFSGKIDANVFGVVSRKYDAGIMPLNVLDLPAFEEVQQQIRVLARSPQIPQFPFIVKTSMEEATLTAIRQEFLSLSRSVPEDRTILDSMQIEKIVEASDADYHELYETTIKNSDYFKKL